MAHKFDTLASEVMNENPFWTYKKDTYVMPSGAKGDYFYVASRGSVMIVPVLENGKLLMTSQFRYLNRRESLEFPGGGRKENLSYFEAAQAELEEETGGIADNLELIGAFNPFNGVTDEICYVYSAKNIIFNIAKPDESEEIVLLEKGADEIIELIEKGTIYDGMTITAFTMFYIKNLKGLKK